MTQEDITWHEMIAVLHRQQKLIFWVTICGTLFSALYLFARGPRYESAAMLMVTTSRAKVAVSPDANTPQTVDRVTDEDLNSQVALLESKDLIREVLTPNQGRLDKTGLLPALGRILAFPLTVPGRTYRLLHGLPAESALEKWVSWSNRHLSVVPLKKSNLIEISYDDPDPEWAATFVNQLVSRHLENHARIAQQPAVRKFFETQRALLGDRVRGAEDAQDDFYRREGWDAVPDRRSMVWQRRTDLEEALQDTETELAAVTARAGFLGSAIEKYPETIRRETHLAQNQAVQFMKPHILELELKRSDLLARYAPTSMKVKDVEQQLADARRLVDAEQSALAETTTSLNPSRQALELDLAQARTQQAGLKARRDALMTRVANAQNRVAHLDEVAAEQRRLAREAEGTKQAFITYTKKEEEARLSSALDASRFVNIAIAQPALVPTEPTPGHKTVLLLFGAVLSLVVAALAAFVGDRLNPAIKSGAEATEIAGIPVLAEIPL